MFERFIVRRKLYNRDINELRLRISEITKQLREQESEKAEAKAQVKAFEKERQMLHREIEQMTKRAKGRIGERDLKEYMSPVPKDEAARREYMAQIAGIFHGGLEDKLKHLHLEFRNQTGMFPLTERETDFFRSCINVVGLLLDWGEQCVAEHHAYIAQANNKAESDAFEDSDEAVENIKSKLNEE